MIENAAADLISQAMPEADDADVDGLRERYGAAVRAEAFDGDPATITEMDALVAYLQMLGTLVDFSTYDPMAQENLR